jgi:hypothetical protein
MVLQCEWVCSPGKAGTPVGAEVCGEESGALGVLGFPGVLSVERSSEEVGALEGNKLVQSKVQWGPQRRGRREGVDVCCMSKVR